MGNVYRQRRMSLKYYIDRLNTRGTDMDRLTASDRCWLLSLWVTGHFINGHFITGHFITDTLPRGYLRTIVRRLRKAQDIILNLSERRNILRAFYLADRDSINQRSSERSSERTAR